MLPVGRRGLGTVITLDNITLRHGNRLVLTGLSGRFESGSQTALIGANGSGKTTLLRAIAGLHPLAGGRIDWDGFHRRDIALLAQGSHLDRSFPITCRDVVALAATRLGPFRSIGKDKLAATRAALERVDLGEMENRPIQALSAGQFQRVLFARTIVQDARLILLDEPFTAVDAATTQVLLSVIQDWHAQGRTVIAVLHDMELVREHFPHTLLLSGQTGHWNAMPDPGLQAA
ncbi:MAG TPA: ABC transporter [Acetobacteraceae bacterium]|nr:ABC transporter [Acetobacteraceae bacterium]